MHPDNIESAIIAIAATLGSVFLFLTFIQFFN